MLNFEGSIKVVIYRSEVIFFWKFEAYKESGVFSADKRQESRTQKSACVSTNFANRQKTFENIDTNVNTWR